MGNTLDTPVTTKETHAGETADGAAAPPELRLQYGVSSMQGWRVTMEDAHICQSTLCAEEKATAGSSGERREQHQHLANNDGYTRICSLPGHSLFAVFDGHGTPFASTYAAHNFTRILCRQPSFGEYAKRITPRATHSIKGKGRKKKGGGGGKKKKGRGVSNNIVIRDDDGGGLRMLLESALRGAFLDADAGMLRELHRIKKEGAAAPKAVDEVSFSKDQDGDAEEKYFDDGDSGTTANVVLFTPQYIICANLGDSRSLLGRNAQSSALILPLSVDHKPDNEEEERRITSAGGEVLGGEVAGRLAVSRALGDFSFKDESAVLVGGDVDRGGKSRQLNFGRDESEAVLVKPEEQKVSPVPDIVALEREAAEDRLFIAACDGIWDVLTNDECVGIVDAIFDEGESNMGLVCEEVIDTCLKKGSRDNMTVIVVKMPPRLIGQGGGVMKRRKLREAAKADNRASRR